MLCSMSECAQKLKFLLKISLAYSFSLNFRMSVNTICLCVGVFISTHILVNMLHYKLFEYMKI